MACGGWEVWEAGGGKVFGAKGGREERECTNSCEVVCEGCKCEQMNGRCVYVTWTRLLLCFQGRKMEAIKIHYEI